MINPWTLIGWSIAFAISTILIGYGCGVIYAAIKSFILEPRERIRHREHTRMMTEIDQMKRLLTGIQDNNGSRILHAMIQAAGGEIKITRQQIVMDFHDHVLEIERSMDPEDDSIIFKSRIHLTRMKK